VFIRLTGCHLRCSYCDTEYAFYEGSWRTFDEILAEVRGYGCSFVEVTGGEPLLQPNVYELLDLLLAAYETVAVETSGAVSIERVDPRIVRIVDLKTPSRGEVARNEWRNLDLLTARDEVKFVLTDRADYDWMVAVLDKHRLHEKVNAVLVSAVNEMRPGLEIAGVPGLAVRDLAEWILQDQLPVRFQTQLHKLVWDPLARGV